MKCYLFRTYCYTIYGAALWATYKVSTMDRLRVNYNNILRRMLNIPQYNSASEMFVQHGLRGFHELRRSSAYSLMSRVLLSSNEVLQRPVHSDARWCSPLWDRWNQLLYRQG